MLVAGTGHRPDKLGGYHADVGEKWTNIAIEWLAAHKPQKVISGMAQGWDQCVAAAAIGLHIPLLAAIPFKGQEDLWPKDVQIFYHWLLGNADSVIVVTNGGYAPWKMQKRNIWMVDQLTKDDILLAVWDGSPGGTANCISYAEGKTIINLYEKGRIS